jgi:hypothetical protein
MDTDKQKIDLGSSPDLVIAWVRVWVGIPN